MAFGIFKKLKDGFKKLGRGVKRIAGKLINTGKKALKVGNDYVVKPLKTPIKAVANAIIPGAGHFIDAASDAIDNMEINEETEE